MQQLFNVFFFAVVFFITGCKSDDEGTTGGETFPLMSINSVSKFEGNNDFTTFNFNVRLNKAADKDVTVEFTTNDKSAVATNDFIATSGKLTFVPGTIEQSIDIQVVTDTLREGDEEFEVLLNNPSGAVINTSIGIGTIRNDDTYLQVPDDGYITPEGYAGYELVWRDEFNGTSIDPNNWKHELGASGWGNNEWQNYTARPENSYISDGKLVIEAKKENYSGSDYTSARMITAGLQEFQYGRIDIRAKLPQGQGIWPALWMLGSNFWDTGWPACGEIDIMEIIGSEPNKLHGTVHWDQNGHAQHGGSTTLSTGTFSDEFHVFTIIWDDQKIRWYLDDNLFNTVDITPPNLSEFKQPFFFIFNVAVGGNWPGYPDDTTEFPQRMYVDYIRVFQ